MLKIKYNSTLRYECDETFSDGRTNTDGIKRTKHALSVLFILWEKWVLLVDSTRKNLLEKYWFVVLRNLVPTARIVAEGTWYVVELLRILISEYSNQGPWLKLSLHRRARLRPLAQRCLSNLKNLVAVTRKVMFSSAQLSERSLFTCTCYMHASASSIEVITLCNVHRFFPVPLKLGKIKIVKYSSTIFWSILCDCKVHSSFWQDCSSCNIGFPSIATSNNLKNECMQFIAIHPYNLVTGTRKKAVASENAWYI